MMDTLRKKYTQKIRPDLKKKLSLKSVMQVPRVEKVVLSMCVPQAVKNPKILNNVSQDLSLIAGQKGYVIRFLCNFEAGSDVDLSGETYSLFSSSGAGFSGIIAKKF